MADAVAVSEASEEPANYESGNESDGGETRRTYEQAVLRIIEESLSRVGGQGSLVAEVRRRMREDRGVLRAIMGRMKKTVRRREDGARGDERAAAAASWRPREVWSSVLRKRAAARAGRHSGQARLGLRSVPGRIRRRVRYTLTGAEDTRVREHLRETVRKAKAKMEEPTTIRTRDKLSFMLGVVGCFVIEFVVVKAPQQFGYVFSAFCVPLIAIRLWIYAGLSWHFFLLDFCYFVNIMCALEVLALPSSRALMMLNFCHTTGPLALAIPTWRNSLVFHSLDKVTSVFIHALPPLLSFTLRWYPPDALLADGPLPATLEVLPAMKLALGGYAAWQVAQLALTEVVFGARIKTDDTVMTSIRWLTTADAKGCYSGIAASACAACRALGVLGPKELFDADTWKTKAIFVTVQLLYTLATMLPVPLMWSSFRLHLAYLLAIYTFCVWNGGSYYIEVFSAKYRKQFEGDLAARRAAAFEALGAPPKVPKHGAEAAGASDATELNGGAAAAKKVD